MSATTLTIVSGIMLLVVFALVGWNLRRKRDSKNENSTMPPIEEESR